MRLAGGNQMRDWAANLPATEQVRTTTAMVDEASD